MKNWVKYYYHNRNTTAIQQPCGFSVVKIIFDLVIHYFHNSHETKLLCGCCENKGGVTETWTPKRFRTASWSMTELRHLRQVVGDKKSNIFINYFNQWFLHN